MGTLCDGCLTEKGTCKTPETSFLRTKSLLALSSKGRIPPSQGDDIGFNSHQGRQIFSGKDASFPEKKYDNTLKSL